MPFAYIAAVQPTRIASVDLIKGLVMVVMALDHVRDYFSADAFLFDPLDLSKTYPALFFTRWVTHFCAPIFSLLAGTSAWFVCQRKGKAYVSRFLLTRGLWLLFAEIVIVNFGWSFSPQYNFLAFQTIGALGMSMVVLAGLVWLRYAVILGIGGLIVIGHNAFDGWQPDSSFWQMLHTGGLVEILPHFRVYFAYPLLPWIGIMALGYCLGTLYTGTLSAKTRQQYVAAIGAGCVLVWIVLDTFSIYGDPTPRIPYPDATRTFLSFLDTDKYPPSLQYTLMTIGPMLVLLAWAEKWKSSAVTWLGTFGRVPFFYYILHIYFIHALAVVWAYATGYGWAMANLPTWVGSVEALRGFGVPLAGVYAVWIGVIIALYPLCRWFDGYKKTHRQHWWLSYL